MPRSCFECWHGLVAWYKAFLSFGYGLDSITVEMVKPLLWCKPP